MINRRFLIELPPRTFPFETRIFYRPPSFRETNDLRITTHNECPEDFLHRPSPFCFSRQQTEKNEQGRKRNGIATQLTFPLLLLLFLLFRGYLLCELSPSYCKKTLTIYHVRRGAREFFFPTFFDAFTRYCWLASRQIYIRTSSKWFFPPKEIKRAYHFVHTRIISRVSEDVRRNLFRQWKLLFVESDRRDSFEPNTWIYWHKYKL